MAHYSGRAGEVDTGSSVTGIRAWTLDYTVSILDTTDFADAGVRTILPNISQWAGTFEGLKDGTAQVLGSSASVSLSLKETQTATQKWTGTAYITGIHPNISYDGTVDYSYDFEGTGVLTPPTA